MVMAQSESVDSVARHSIFMNSVKPRVDVEFGEYKFALTSLLANPMLVMPFTVDTKIKAQHTPAQAFEFSEKMTGVSPLAVDVESKELVSASNIQDKELILNVLSMYKDPQEREEQIRNLSLGFQELAQEILPQLRRARMIINYEIVGRSDEKIAALYASTPDSLSADEILYHATHCKSIDQKEEAYKKCAQLYPNDYRAYNNVAAMEFAKGNLDATRFWVKRALAVNPNAGEAQSNLALAALKQGKLQEAEGYMAKAGNSNDLNRVQGAVNFVKGNYKKAAVDYKDVNNNMAALAQIMAKDYSAARATFNQIGDNRDDGATHHLSRATA